MWEPEHTIAAISVGATVLVAVANLIYNASRDRNQQVHERKIEEARLTEQRAQGARSDVFQALDSIWSLAITVGIAHLDVWFALEPENPDAQETIHQASIELEKSQNELWAAKAHAIRVRQLGWSPELQAKASDLEQSIDAAIGLMRDISKDLMTASQPDLQEEQLEQMRSEHVDDKLEAATNAVRAQVEAVIEVASRLPGSSE